jgi:hypothetical protein
VRAGPATFPGRAKLRCRCAGCLVSLRSAAGLIGRPRRRTSAANFRRSDAAATGASRSPWRRPQKRATGRPRVGYRDDDALGFGPIGCLAGYPLYPPLHNAPQASLRRGFFCTEIEAPRLFDQAVKPAQSALNQSSILRGSVRLRIHTHTRRTRTDTSASVLARS